MSKKTERAVNTLVVIASLTLLAAGTIASACGGSSDPDPEPSDSRTPEQNGKADEDKACQQQLECANDEIAVSVTTEAYDRPEGFVRGSSRCQCVITSTDAGPDPSLDDEDEGEDDEL